MIVNNKKILIKKGVIPDLGHPPPGGIIDMKKNHCILAAFSSVSLAVHATEQDLQAFIQRINPAHAGEIQFAECPPDAGRECFQITAENNQLQLAGSSELAKASAYGWYLNHVANSHLSWSGDQLGQGLPLPTEPISKTTPYRYRFAYNYCALSYTMAFWGWERWEREIDFLALNGYSHALVTAGLEKVWQETLRELDYPESKIKEFIPNPAFAAWWNMGNLEGHGGPLTQNLIDGEAKLGRQIATRMKALGMTPTLQGFVGILPRDIGKYQKDLQLVPQGEWVGFDRPIVLDPTSDDYQRIAAIWYKHLHKVYGGPTQAYGGDLFHEGGKHGNINVTDAAKAVQSAMQKASPDSTWVLMSWQANPAPDLVRGTDPEKTMILQLCRNMKDGNNGGGIRTYQNRPWLWSELANFGANHNLYGGNQLVASLPDFLLDPAKNRGDMAGLALLSEGIETNPFYYSIFHDAFWRSEDIDLNAWIPAYGKRRYGVENKHAVEALNLLNDSVYSPRGIQEGCIESILCSKPSLDARKASSWSSTELYYNPVDVLDAAESFLKAAPELGGQATYRYDLVDTTRQVLADLARPVLAEARDAYSLKDKKAFKTYAKLYMDLLVDTDELLASDKHWLLGTWIERAKAKGRTSTEKRLMETAARRLITIWSNQPDALDEYSHRQWAGLMKDYYLPRWQAFFAVHLNAIEKTRTPDTVRTWYADLRAEKDVAFSSERKVYSTQPKGDTVAIATRILKRYAPIARKLWSTQKQSEGLPWTLGTKKELVWNVSEIFIREGTYLCSIEWKGGQNALEIQSLALYEGDKEITEDKHEGWTGMENRDNTYVITLNKLRTNLDAYTLRAKVNGAGGTDSRGIIKIRKVKK